MVAVKDVGVEVEAVRPDDRPQLRVDANLAKDLRVAQWLARRAPKDVAQVDDALGATVEAQAEL